MPSAPVNNDEIGLMPTCGKGSGVSKFDYVQVLFYPNPQDAKTYLCCKIAAKEASLMLGI